ncbi:MAG: TolC family outer membrane protein [Oceanospirillaceae bacterium]
MIKIWGKKLCCIGVMSVAPILAHGEDLLDIYEMAKQNDPVNSAGIFQNEASKEIYQQARATLLPTVKFDYTKTRTTQEIVSSDNTVYQSGSTSYPTTEYGLSITQSIYSFSNWAYFKQAKEDVRRSAAEYEDVRQDLLMRVAQSYFAALKERDNFISTNAEVSSLIKHHELVKQQHEDGVVRITDYLDAEARLMQAQARQVEVVNDLRDAFQGLQEITGTLPKSLVTLGDQLKPAYPKPKQVSAWVENARQQNPLILAKKSALAVALQESRRQRGAHYPTLDLVASQNSRTTTGSLFGGGSEVETRDILLKLSVPIYSGGAVSSKVREALRLRDKAKAELLQTQRATEREARSAFNGIVGAVSKVNALQKSVDAYEIAADAKQTAFDSGLVSSVNVLDATRDLYIARSDFSAAQYDYLINTLSLKRATGTLSIDDLGQVNSMLEGEDISTDVELMLRKAKVVL